MEMEKVLLSPQGILLPFQKTKSPATSHSSLDTARSLDFWALRDVSLDVRPGRLWEISVAMAGTMGTGLLDMIDLWQC